MNIFVGKRFLAPTKSNTAISSGVGREFGQPLLYPKAKLWSVSQVSPEQHSKILDLQITHCSCPCTTTVFRGDWHLGNAAGVRWLGSRGYPSDPNHFLITTAAKHFSQTPSCKSFASSFLLQATQGFRDIFILFIDHGSKSLMVSTY